MRLFRTLSAATALFPLLCSVADAAKEPKVNQKAFDNLPQTYFYFDDSATILFLEQNTLALWRSEDDGATWNKVEDIPEKKAADIFQHPFDNHKAYLLTKGKIHYVTGDRGKTWRKFEVPLSPANVPLAFHAAKSGYVIYTGASCKLNSWGSWDCHEQTFYTKDGFDSDPKPLRKDPTHSCIFARSTKIFDKAPDYRIFCIVDGTKGGPEHRRILYSDDFFANEHEPLLDGVKRIEGVAGLAAVQKFIVAAVKSEGTDEMALFVTHDAEDWDRAHFPEDHGGLKQDAYTILESTPHSIQVDVLTTTSINAVGSLFTSNSNGSYFTRNIDHTNRDHHGLVDFEQVQGIQGIVLVNIVDNADELKKSKWGDIDKVRKKIKSKISFDDGRTWTSLKTKRGDLHVHSVTTLRNGGRVFSSPAPGLLMAVGNTGDYLKAYEDGDLYVSDDAGLTWNPALKDAHMYEFGDSGSILVAVNDEEYVDKFRYSLNHGKDWEEASLGVKVRTRALTTVPDSTTKKFTLIATEKGEKTHIFCIDFTGAWDDTCKDSDYEKWYARLDENGKPDCLMGHKQYFMRRKKDAKCFVNKDYKDPIPETEVCPCTREDYECDYNFRRNEKRECELFGKRVVPDGACKKPEDTFKGSSGYRLIPGNDCDHGKGEKLDELVPVQCKDEAVKTPPSNGKVKDVKTTFAAKKFREYYYLERPVSASGHDETIVARTDKNEIWVTHDHGSKWEQPADLKKAEIIAIYPNPYNSDHVYFLTPSKDLYLTSNRGKSYHKLVAPGPPTTNQEIPVMRFHPLESDRIIWTTDEDCENMFSSNCHAVAYYTRDRGKTWLSMLTYVRNCAWMQSKEMTKTPENTIFCERYTKEQKPGPDNLLQLWSSQDFFQTKSIVNPDIMGFATMNEFILIAAVKQDGSELKLDASIDGVIFADAKFPPNFQVDHQQAYTVLDSVTHAVFLHVTVNPRPGREYGSILKSNSNGTSYVLSLNGANRNEMGYVDFEKMQGLEGVAIVNVVRNTEQVDKLAQKKLKTMITHNDGGHWDYIPAPEKGVDGKPYSCGHDAEKCSLNLHGYTERKDYRDTFSSGSAVGLMIGVGNVGEYLTGKKNGNTYLTRDGGISWKEIRKGSYMWEYGDQGSIIVIVDEYEPTNKVFYSLDEGNTWEGYSFGDKMSVEDITTIPSDTSRKFLLWGVPTGHAEKYMTVQIDFTGLTDTQCEFPKDNKGGDFELWEPKHPAQKDNCLFGHKSQYYRKILGHNCYIGSKLLEPNGSPQTCFCTEHDYECDYNYERQRDGTCKLVPGVQPPDHKQACANNRTLVEWYPPTGYRRIPLTTCAGGKEWDKGIPKSCPGHEGEFQKKHGASGVAIFFGVVFSVTVAAGVGYWVWTKWQGKFGAIRLGDERNGEQSTLIRYPIIVISGIVAVAVAIPAILSALGSYIISKVSRPRRYTTRGSFARGEYSVVNTDEGELLGSDDEEEA